MSNNRFGLGGSSKEEERPIISGHSDKEDFAKALTGYLTSMKESNPNVHHPPIDRLTKGFSMILTDQDQSVTASPEQCSLAAAKEVVRNKLQAFLQPLADMQWRLDKHSSRHTVIEINSRQFQVSQRERDRKFCVNAFQNKAHRFHAADLFDIESIPTTFSSTLPTCAQVWWCRPSASLFPFGQPVSQRWTLPMCTLRISSALCTGC